jgi:hypothetical protein
VKQVQDKNGEVTRRMLNIENAVCGGSPLEQIAAAQANTMANQGASGQGSAAGESLLGSARGDNKSVGSMMNRNRSPEATSKGLPLIQRSPMLKRGGTRADAGTVQEIQNRMI